jgi:predicted alpha/beta hydrolase family esterase
MTDIIIPGIGNSGPAHWQSHWERTDLSAQRIRPASWDQPDCNDWIAALDDAVARSEAPRFLIAHSLGCLLVAIWAARPSRARVDGALLVGVPDPDGPAFPAERAASFRKVPLQALPFPALMVASENDPYASLNYSRGRAREWGCDFVNAGALGHINEDSGLADWPQGAQLLAAFRARALAKADQ